MLILAAIGLIAGLLAGTWRRFALAWVLALALMLAMQVFAGYRAAAQPGANAGYVWGLVVAASIYGAVVVSVATLIGHALRMAWRKFAKGEPGRFET